MEDCYCNPYLLCSSVMTLKDIENINEFREDVTPHMSSFLVHPHWSDLWVLLLPRLSLILSSWFSDVFFLHILLGWLQSHGFKHHLYTDDSMIIFQTGNSPPDSTWISARHLKLNNFKAKTFLVFCHSSLPTVLVATATFSPNILSLLQLK